MSHSLINAEAAARISSGPGGAYLIEIFKAMEVQMNVMQSQGQFSQMQFIGNDPNELKEGDLIPELHFSLRRYSGPILSEGMEVTEGDE